MKLKITLEWNRIWTGLQRYLILNVSDCHSGQMSWKLNRITRSRTYRCICIVNNYDTEFNPFSHCSSLDNTHLFTQHTSISMIYIDIVMYTYHNTRVQDDVLIEYPPCARVTDCPVQFNSTLNFSYFLYIIGNINFYGSIECLRIF